MFLVQARKDWNHQEHEDYSSKEVKVNLDLTARCKNKVASWHLGVARC
jgi:hypothetical protein